MQSDENRDTMFHPVEAGPLRDALSALGRTINIVSTYGAKHRAFEQSVESAMTAMEELFKERKKLMLGAYSGILTIDEKPVSAAGSLLKSLERHLVRLRITSLRIARGISAEELATLAELLACKDSDDFNEDISQSGLSHIESETTRLQAVRDGQTVANESDLAGTGGNGVLVLEDELLEEDSESSTSAEAPVHVDQIVAFLQGDLEKNDARVEEELSELASDPARLGQMVMESVAIRQSASQLSGESLSDVILGCLRRTYSGLRKQPAFQTSEGMANLQKSLLLLEESMLEKMRDLAGDADPELDRQIVQAIREIDEDLGFEMAAREYIDHQQAIDTKKQELKEYLSSRGADAASSLISSTDFPASDWRRIIVESRKSAASGGAPPMATGLETLTRVFQRLESLMKSEEADQGVVRDLIGEASENLDDTVCSAKEKLNILSKQLEDTGTIGGQGREMTRKEILSSIAEIAQELMQPLTAISATHEMMLKGYSGKINPEQRSMLDLANNSGEHLAFLIEELIEIVGCPANKGVDERFHTTSDQVALLKKKAC